MSFSLHGRIFSLRSETFIFPTCFFDGFLMMISDMSREGAPI